jgi:hypothetical protein
MSLTLADARKLFKITVDKQENEWQYHSIILKETGTWFGYIETNNVENEQIAQFIGENWLANQVSESGTLEMRYPVRKDQYATREVEFVPLEHQSAFNQATLDAMHYFYQTRAFAYPNYSPLTFK